MIQITIIKCFKLYLSNNKPFISIEKVFWATRDSILGVFFFVRYSGLLGVIFLGRFSFYEILWTAGVFLLSGFSFLDIRRCLVFFFFILFLLDIRQPPKDSGSHPDVDNTWIFYQQKILKKVQNRELYSLCHWYLTKETIDPIWRQ